MCVNPPPPYGVFMPQLIASELDAKNEYDSVTPILDNSYSETNSIPFD